jgi:hypothetical protein
MSKSVEQFYFLPHFAVMPKDFYACLTNCVVCFAKLALWLIKKVLVGQTFLPKKSSHEKVETDVFQSMTTPDQDNF